MVFLTNPVTMEQLKEVAFAGEVMPQKSTDFYPKLSEWSHHLCAGVRAIAAPHCDRRTDSSRQRAPPGPQPVTTHYVYLARHRCVPHPTTRSVPHPFRRFRESGIRGSLHSRAHRFDPLRQTSNRTSRMRLELHRRSLHLAPAQPPNHRFTPRNNRLQEPQSSSARPRSAAAAPLRHRARRRPRRRRPGRPSLQRPTGEKCQPRSQREAAVAARGARLPGGHHPRVRPGRRPEPRAEIANHAEARACISLHAAETGSGVHLFVSSLAPAAPPAFVAWKTAQAAWVTRSLALAGVLNPPCCTPEPTSPWAGRRCRASRA